MNREPQEQEMDMLYSLARQYPLLEAQEECYWDEQKWDASLQLLGEICGCQPHLHDLLALLQSLYDAEPRVEDFSSREYYFLVQREIKDIEHRIGDGKRLFDAFNAEQLPATLIVGFAELLLDQSSNNPVKAALSDWYLRQRQLLPPSPAGKTAGRPMLRQVRRYFEARDKLTLHNLRLVFTIAGRSNNRDIPYPDLVQEGLIGLIRAAEKYRHTTGNRFSTYAFNWINQAIRRYAADHGGVIRYPTHVQELVSRLYRVRADLWARQLPTDPASLARAAGVSEDKVRQTLALRNLATPLDEPQFDDGESPTLGQQLQGGPFPGHESLAWQASLNRQLMATLERLEPQEAEVIRHRWGLDGGPSLSRAQLADKMQVSREWVRQLELTGLRKLQHDPAVRQTYNLFKTEGDLL